MTDADREAERRSMAVAHVAALILDNPTAAEPRAREEAERHAPEPPADRPMPRRGKPDPATAEPTKQVEAEVRTIMAQADAEARRVRGETQRGVANRQAEAICDAWSRMADDMTSDPTFLRPDAMIAARQVRDACLDMYRAKGVPGAM